MKYKIIGFTHFEDGSDKDCIAITAKGEKIIVDPFVGCAWEFENRETLLNTWFETETERWHVNSNPAVLMPAEDDFKLLQLLK